MARMAKVVVADTVVESLDHERRVLGDIAELVAVEPRRLDRSYPRSMAPGLRLKRKERRAIHNESLPGEESRLMTFLRARQASYFSANGRLSTNRPRNMPPRSRIVRCETILGYNQGGPSSHPPPLHSHPQ